MKNKWIKEQKKYLKYIFSYHRYPRKRSHFLETFERQSLCTRIDGDLDLINNLFCCEKVYYFYCDKMNKKKIMNGNMIKYLLQQLNTKISKNKNSKINSLDIENYIMINLYLLFISTKIQNWLKSLILWKNSKHGHLR
jgi:hypothetical protein